MGELIDPSSLVLDRDPAMRPFGDAAARRGEPRGWDFLGAVPVPLRHRIRDGVGDLATRIAAEGGPALKCCFPMGQGGRGHTGRLRFIGSLDDYPDMLVSDGQGDSFNRRFYEAHVAGGAFTGSQPGRVASVFADCGLIDPKGWIGVYAVAPFGFLIDHQKLNGLPAPRRWADLADPAYRGQVIFGGWRRGGEGRWSEVNKFFLLNMAREFGLDGLARILRNVPTLLHSAQMPRLAGADASPGGIYILPWSLADICPRRAHTKVVWPEDGALAYPLWLTTKVARRVRLDPLLRHFHGAELARYLGQNRYPALCPDLAPALPEGARLKWLGWDFLRHRSTAQLIKAASRMFHESQDRFEALDRSRVLEDGSCV
jgi:ABC-type Fe3+ transport system substrate-binding protein